MSDPVAVLGWSTTDFLPDQGLAPDELAFAVSSAALRDAAIRKADVGLALLVSSDLYDARTISNGMTTPAAGGYLNDEYRLENDAAMALGHAATTIRGGHAEYALVTALHSPSRPYSTAEDWSAFHDQISNYTFDPHFNRPVGITGRALLGMQAAASIDSGAMTREEMANLAALEIERGSTGPRAFRREPVTAEAVLQADHAAWPLTEMMMPALCTGAVSVVLGSRTRSRRSRRVHGWLKGWGFADTPYVWNPQWLEQPALSAGAAASRAYEQAGVTRPEDEIALAETTVLSPALDGPVSAALGIEQAAKQPGRLNLSGGVRTTYPGLANGALRLVEMLTGLAELAGHGAVPQGLIHSTDWITGTAASTATVIVVEGA